MTLFAMSIVMASCRATEARPTLSDAEVVSAPTAVGATPMFAVSPAGVRTVAWVSAPNGGSDGRLYVATGGAPTELRDSLGPIEPHGEAPPKLAYGRDGTLYALYAVVKLVPGKRFPHATLRLATSRDDGRSWSAPATVTGDTTSGSRNFHALHVADDGTVYVAWLESSQGKAATFITRSEDGGRSWRPAVRVDPIEACPCCRTAIATSRDGALYLAWRTVLPGNVRDVVVARSADKGTSWSSPVRVHADDWVYPGCPHAGPSMQVDSAGRVHISWWTGKEGSAGAYYARSSDGARTFSPPLDLGTADYSAPAHVQLALGTGGVVVAAWDDGTLKLPRVMMRVSRDGGESFDEAVALSRAGAAATFPVLALTGQRVTVAWSEQRADAHERAEHHKAKMSDPKQAATLPEVGATRVLVRSGELR